MGGQDERRRPDTDRRGDEADGGERFASAIGAKKMMRRTQRMRKSHRRSTRILFASLVVSACFAISAFAQMTTAPASSYRRDPGIPSSVVPKPLREVGYDQHLDERVPLDIPFADESGRTVRLGDYFGARPVVLA